MWTSIFRRSWLITKKSLSRSDLCGPPCDRGSKLGFSESNRRVLGFGSLGVQYHRFRRSDLVGLLTSFDEITAFQSYQVPEYAGMTDVHINLSKECDAPNHLTNWSGKTTVGVCPWVCTSIVREETTMYSPWSAQVYSTLTWISNISSLMIHN